MLGIGGKFAAARGMVRVPNLAGLSPSDADIVLANAGLKRGNQSSSSTSNSSNNNKINTQSIAANTLVDYESTISYNYEYYVAPYQPTVSYGACETYNTQSTGGWCDGTTWNYPIYTYQRRRAVKYDGAFAYWDYSFCPDESGGGGSEKVDGLCGYVAPTVCTGTAGSNTYKSSCSGGEYFITTRYWDACGNDIKRVTNFYDCCTAGLVSCTSWSGSSGGQSRVCTYRRADCSTYTVTETRCAASSSTTCGSCIRVDAGIRYQTCTTTTVSTSCDVSTRTFTQKC